jgi:UDP-glucose 4-epimerase
VYARVLVAGVDTPEGYLLAKSLEARDDVEVIIGCASSRQGLTGLGRTQVFVTDYTPMSLNRIVVMSKAEALVHLFLADQAPIAGLRQLNENNVIRTMNLLAAAGHRSSSVRHVIMRSYDVLYPADSTSPALWRELPDPPLPPAGPARTVGEAERYLKDFADDNPHVVVTLLRHSPLVGPGVTNVLMRNLLADRFPVLLGFDPVVSVLSLDDLVRAVEFVLVNPVPGVFNVAADSPRPISWILGRARVPKLYLPAVLTRPSSAVASLFSTHLLSDEFLTWLRFGRALDNSSLKAAGFSYLKDTGEIARDVASMRASAGKVREVAS